jgi:hypothetical protein
MGRHSLSTVMALGAVISLIGGAGLFAVFTDRATTAENSAVSGDRPHLEALQMAPGALTVEASIACGTFSDDLATPLVAMTNAQPGDGHQEYVCITNTSSLDLLLSMTIVDLHDVETACTGDEPAFDPSCVADEPGELSSVLFGNGSIIDCATASGPGSGIRLADLAAGQAVTLGTLTAGSTGCFLAGATYPFYVADIDQQVAQTDQATWRFAFDGTE